MPRQSRTIRHGTLGLALAALLAAKPAPAAPQNAGTLRVEVQAPFAVTPIAEFDRPWALAFLPDGRMLVTEKPGALYLVTPQGRKTRLGGLPEVAYGGQLGLLDVAISPDFAKTRRIYLSYAEPGPGGAGLALARGRLDAGAARIAGLQVLWRQLPKGGGGQPGGIIAFDPAGRHLFLTTGERQRFDPAQDPDQALGKTLRLTLDGRPASSNPMVAAGGTRAMTWSTGHRNPYGLAFAPDGRLWEHEMGPRGGDELNLIVAGGNYGWPLVSYGDHYSGEPIPRPPTRPEFREPALYWTPVIAPAGMIFYSGSLFPGWTGTALIGGLRGQALVRVAMGPGNSARQLDRWDMGARIRDVAEAPDGSVWLLEDGPSARLLRLTPR